MKPKELWNAIGAIIAQECNCTEMWDHTNGLPLTPRGPVTTEEMVKICARVVSMHWQMVEVAQ
jgi:hypothetical protein